MNVPQDPQERRHILIDIRRGLAALTWYYGELEYRLAEPDFKVKSSRVVLLPKGQIDITVRGNCGASGRSDQVLSTREMVNILVSNVKIAFKTFADTKLIRSPYIITEAPCEAELDKCFRIMLPFYPSPESMPASKFLAVARVPAVKRIHGHGATPESASKDALDRVVSDETSWRLTGEYSLDKKDALIETIRCLKYDHPSTFLI